MTRKNCFVSRRGSSQILSRSDSYGTLAGSPSRLDPDHLQKNPNNQQWQLFSGGKNSLIFEIFPPDENGTSGC